MKYIKLFEDYQSGTDWYTSQLKRQSDESTLEEEETLSLPDLKKRLIFEKGGLIDLLKDKYGKDCNAKSNPQNVNLFTIFGPDGQELECEIKPYLDDETRDYTDPKYVVHLKSDEIPGDAKGPWSFTKGKLHYLAQNISHFFK